MTTKNNAPVVAASELIDDALLNRIADAHGDSEDPAQFVRNGWGCAGVDNVRAALDELMGYVRAAAPAASELERAVLDMANMLAGNEWAEHVSDHPAAAALESGITRLVGRVTPAVQQPAEGGWISVDERLPEQYERVLALKDCGEGTLHSYAVAFVDRKSKDCWFADGYSGSIAYVGYRVTHWQPLPAAPTQAEG